MSEADNLRGPVKALRAIVNGMTFNDPNASAESMVLERTMHKIVGRLEACLKRAEEREVFHGK